MRAKDKKGK